MKMTDPTLQAAAEAFYAVTFPEYTDPDGETFEPGRPADFLTATELEQLLASVRAAIAAPVLALHRPCHPVGQGDRCSIGHAEDADLPPICRCCMMWPVSYELYPCATARALGVAA